MVAAGANVKRWLWLSLGLIPFCPEPDHTKTCNDDHDCVEDAGQRCQILTNPETGKKEGECVFGGQPVEA